MQIGSDADPHFRRSVDVARQRCRAGNRQEALGVCEATWLGVVDRKHLRGVEPDYLEHVLGGPGTFVGHHRDVDARAHFGHRPQPFDWLLDVDEIVFLHGSNHPHRFPPGAVTLVGIDADLASPADSWRTAATTLTSRSASTPILTLMVVMPSAITSAASRAAASASMIPMLCASAVPSRTLLPRS